MIRDYALSFLLALLVHVAAAAALWAGWTPNQPDTVELVKPQLVKAELVQLEAAAPKPQPAPPKATPEPEPAPEPEPEIDRAEQEREQRERQRERERRERERQAERERQQRLAELAASSFDEALASEAEALQAEQHEQVAQSYAQGIYQLIVASWSRPPSARNDMEARFMVELVPTGELVSVTLVKSSGNTAFDRSAEQAIKRAGKFDVPDDPRVFETYFRRFPVRFKPEDLLR